MKPNRNAYIPTKILYPVPLSLLQFNEMDRAKKLTKNKINTNVNRNNMLINSELKLCVSLEK
jgi:hypothetical protein